MTPLGSGELVVVKSILLFVFVFENIIFSVVRRGSIPGAVQVEEVVAFVVQEVLLVTATAGVKV